TKGMVFIVYGNGNFVAHLRIADVSAATSAGVVFNQVADVKQGDKVTTRLDSE
ncbi:hypothetical protein LCGC14_1872120, partial [marine sediment metagenome]